MANPMHLQMLGCFCMLLLLLLRSSFRLKGPGPGSPGGGIQLFAKMGLPETGPRAQAAAFSRPRSRLTLLSSEP